MSPSTSARPTDHRVVAKRRFLPDVSAAFARCGGVLRRGRLRPRQQALHESRPPDLGGVTLLQGAGCNVIAMPGPDGALMIDGGLAANADALLAAVRSCDAHAAASTR